ncbi:unnamed protein product [Strongylus vulgaris]|uniref:Uncharacterized protein n=1 Tax=Strongylus vulgaris TaxID=40348 RepID=A0A3P7JAG9_STRVU|nr:unnamed protein product [Strongylus vulgaris]
MFDVVLFQYQQNLLHRQQYLLTSGVSQDHKEHQNGRVAATPNLIQFPGGASFPPNHCYPHTAIYPQQHAVQANVPYPVVVPGRPLGSRVATVPQRLPPHMIMQTRYTAGVQPASNYVAQGIPMRPGVQYPNVPVRYMPYEGEMEAPVYIPAQGQVTMPPGTVIYTRDGCPVKGEEEDVGTKRRRTGKRKKESVDDESNQQKDAVEPTGPPAPLTHGELLKQKKRNMAFPKGTFLVRYADLESEEYAGHIWLVDNHQLLQKYTYDGLDASNVKVFSRTERVSSNCFTTVSADNLICF